MSRKQLAIYNSKTYAREGEIASHIDEIQLAFMFAYIYPNNVLDCFYLIKRFWIGIHKLFN